jgi:hypothetical protein
MTTPKNRNFHVESRKAGVDEPAAARRLRGSDAPLHYFSSIQMSIKLGDIGVLGNPERTRNEKARARENAGFRKDGMVQLSGCVPERISGRA